MSILEFLLFYEQKTRKKFKLAMDKNRLLKEYQKERGETAYTDKVFYKQKSISEKGNALSGVEDET